MLSVRIFSQYLDELSSVGFTYRSSVRKACAREYIEFNSTRPPIPRGRLKNVEVELSVIICVPCCE